MVIRKIQDRGYTFAEAELVVRNIVAEFKKPTIGHEHRGTGQADVNESGMGAGMSGVWLQIVAVLPHFFTSNVPFLTVQ